MDNVQLYQHFINQATSTVTQAIEADNAGKPSIAVGMYVSATVLYMKALENVSDEDFKRRVKAEVSKYLQRAKDLREMEKQQTQPSLKTQVHSQLQQIQQQQQALKQQKEELKQQWNSPVPLEQPTPPSKQQQKQPQQTPQQTPQQPPSTQPTSQHTGILGSIMNKFSHGGQAPAPAAPTHTQKKQSKKSRKKKKKSRSSDSDESDESEESAESEEEESTDEECDAQVEDLVRQVQKEETQGEENDEQEETKGKSGETEYLTEIPDEETLKTIDKMLLEEEKRVQADVRQANIDDDKIANKIAEVGFGMKLGLDEKGATLDGDVLNELIMESRIAALSEEGKSKSKKSAKKK